MHDTVALTGWRPDPTARHEGRYYVAGRPTSRVRNGRAETTDTAGGQLLPGYVELPSSRRTTRPIGVARHRCRDSRHRHAGGRGLGASTPTTSRQPSPDANYLSALRDSGLAGQFNSDANALAHGRQVCRQLDDGGPQQGLASDKIAIDFFCPQFAEGFHILETATVSGTFVLTDTKSGRGRQLDRNGRGIVRRHRWLLGHRQQHSGLREERQGRDLGHHIAWQGPWQRSHLHVLVQLSGH